MVWNRSTRTRVDEYLDSKERLRWVGQVEWAHDTLCERTIPISLDHIKKLNQTIFERNELGSLKSDFFFGFYTKTYFIRILDSSQI